MISSYLPIYIFIPFVSQIFPVRFAICIMTAYRIPRIQHTIFHGVVSLMVMRQIPYTEKQKSITTEHIICSVFGFPLLFAVIINSYSEILPQNMMAGPISVSAYMKNKNVLSAVNMAGFLLS